MNSSAFYLVGITVGPALMVVSITWMCCKLVVETLEHSAEQNSDWLSELRAMRMHQQHLMDLLTKAQSQPSPLTPAETQAPSVPSSGSASASSASAEAGVSL